MKFFSQLLLFIFFLLFIGPPSLLAQNYYPFTSVTVDGTNWVSGAYLSIRLTISSKLANSVNATDFFTPRPYPISLGAIDNGLLTIQIDQYMTFSQQVSAFAYVSVPDSYCSINSASSCTQDRAYPGFLFELSIPAARFDSSNPLMFPAFNLRQAFDPYVLKNGPRSIPASFLFVLVHRIACKGFQTG